MAKISDVIWKGLSKRIAKVASALCGENISVREIPRREGELGYTAKGHAIHLTRDHPVLDALDTLVERIFCIKGIG